MIKRITQFTTFLYLFVLHLMRSIRLSFIIGSKASFFSLSTALTPTLGFFASSYTSTILLGIRAALSIGLLSQGVLPYLAYHIPTYCGTLYLSFENRVLKIALPLLCIMLFLCHPVGYQTYFYTFYWIIPLFIAWFAPQSIFLQALGSTFTTHAVGSLLWLYANKLDVAMIQSLLHIVWLERLVFACMITGAYYAWVAGQALVNQKKFWPALFSFYHEKQA